MHVCTHTHTHIYMYIYIYIYIYTYIYISVIYICIYIYITRRPPSYPSPPTRLCPGPARAPHAQIHAQGVHDPSVDTPGDYPPR